MNLALSTLSPEKQCAKWNSLFPAGTPVLYGTKRTVTTSKAFVLVGHVAIAVVSIEGAHVVGLAALEPQPRAKVRDAKEKDV
jgi:hypothetical protein